MLMASYTKQRSLAAVRKTISMHRRSLASSTVNCVDIPVLSFEPHATLDHPLHGSTASFAPQPSIIVLQEWWGVNDQIKDHAQRIANNTGAKTYVPDLYNGKSTADAEEASHMMGNLDWDKALKSLEDLSTKLQTVDGQPAKLGATGFCMGGALSLALAGRMAKTKTPLNAVVAFYGIPPAKFDVSGIPAKTPVQAHFGSEDNYVGFSDLTAAKALAKKWGIHN
ncbi:dienelactone hydrolase family-domain-containing protein [Chytridium lagenaria]|nr:dienelactone hydrolase family-domain-containing protein [Chytridium lagenaria]